MAHFQAEVDKNILTVLLIKGYVERFGDGITSEIIYQTTDKGDALLERLLNNTRL